MRPNLPIQLTSFIGRQSELAEVRSLVRRQPLVTLTGPGGVGKTRLALEVAQGLAADFPDGVWMVELAPLADARLVPQAVATVIGVREQPGQRLLATLAEALEPRRLLLILDNCEHVVDACAEVADILLHSCFELRILATTREPLNVAGETVWLVPPLSVPAQRESPDRAVLEDSEAVQLFVDRATTAKRDFSLADRSARALIRICERLDGIPLALELAAARVRVLTIEQIVARLDDHFSLLSTGSRTSPTRHQTLRATVTWSFALLSAPEQSLFAQLSVFAGGWTLEAAEAVCLAHDPEQPTAGETRTLVVDLLGRLVDKSLVTTDSSRSGVRYRLLEMLRQYGSEQLRVHGVEADVRRRHATYFLQLLEGAEIGLTGSSQAVFLELLEQEHDNLRAALRWSIESGDIVLGLRMAWVMWRFWWVRGYLSEGRQRVAELLDLARPAGSEALLVNGLVSAGLLAMWQGDYPAARTHLEDALSKARQHEHPRAAAYALAFLTRVLRDQGAEAEGRSLGLEAVAQFRQLDDAWGLAIALHFLGLATEAAALQEARSLFEESAAIFRRLGSVWDVAMPLRGLGDVAFLEGKAAQAEPLYERSASLFQERGDEWSVAMLRTQLGYTALARRNLGRAASLFTNSLSGWRKLGHRRGAVLCLAGLASIVADRGAYTQAATLAGAVEAACDQHSVALEPVARATYRARVERARLHLGASRFTRAWNDGHTLNLDAAVSIAVAAANVETVARSAGSGLTAREREVARLIADGLTNRQIAKQLVISERTADRHVENILRKLGCVSRAQIAARATELVSTMDAPFHG